MICPMAESGNGSAAYRWAWFALACVVVALWCVLNRWHLHRCTEFTFAEEGFARPRGLDAPEERPPSHRERPEE